MSEVYTRLDALLNPARLLDAALAWLPDLIVGLVTACAFWLAWRLVGKAMSVVFGRSELDPTAAAFVHTIVKYTVGAVALVTVLGQVGINTGSLLASLGVAGLTIGFAARDALSNVISGLFIFWDRPFVIGDLVEVDGRYGTVDKITMRSTRLVTPDGKMLAIPNNTVVNTPVTSYTNFPHLRIDMAVTVGVNEDIAKVRRLLLGVVAADAREWMSEPAPVVVVQNLGDYNIEVELRAWLADERHHVAARAALCEAILEAFRSAGVDMPFETLQLQPLEVRALAA